MPGEEPAPYAYSVSAPPARRRFGRRSAEAAGIGAVLLALFAKFKGVLFFLLKFKWIAYLAKFALSGGSLILSIASWALLFGWVFAVGFVALIFVHEMGHVIALRARGINASVPIFIPFLGAFVAMKEMPPNAKVEAEVALAGPLLGTAGAAVCLLLGMQTQSRFWYALASTGFFINLFNMLPVLPLDGGRVVAALSPKFWALGIAALVASAFLFPGAGLLFVGLLVVMSLPRIVQAFKPGALDAPYYHVPAKDRWLIGLEYFGLAIFLTIMWVLAGNAVRVAPHYVPS